MHHWHCTAVLVQSYAGAYLGMATSCCTQTLLIASTKCEKSYVAIFICNARIDITDLKAPNRHLYMRGIDAHLLKRELTENVYTSLICTACYLKGGCMS